MCSVHYINNNIYCHFEILVTQRKPYILFSLYIFSLTRFENIHTNNLSCFEQLRGLSS